MSQSLKRLQIQMNQMNREIQMIQVIQSMF